VFLMSAVGCLLTGAGVGYRGVVSLTASCAMSRFPSSVAGKLSKMVLFDPCRLGLCNYGQPIRFNAKGLPSPTRRDRRGPRMHPRIAIVMPFMRARDTQQKQPLTISGCVRHWVGWAPIRSKGYPLIAPPPPMHPLLAMRCLSCLPAASRISSAYEKWLRTDWRYGRLRLGSEGICS